MTEKLTQAEKDLGPCLCCGSPKLGHWQVAYDGADAVGALCFDCYCIVSADNSEGRVRKAASFVAAHPDIQFAPYRK